MNKVKFSLFALVALFAVACVQDPTMEETNATVAKSDVAKKFINTPDNAVGGELILFVNEETAEAWASAEDATRAGLKTSEIVAAEIGVETIKPVFNMAINGDEKRAQNLHRWFYATFDK